MHAAILHNINQPLHISDKIEIPALKYGQLLVEIAYSGVCRSQLMEMQGGRGDDKYLPHLLGHEATGIVRDIGDSVTKCNIGDKVILTWIRSQGIEAGGVQYPCHDNNIQSDLINAGAITSFNSHAIVSENRVVPLPKGVPMDIGVLFGCALTTGAGAILNDIQPHKNSSIAIFGLGGIGLSALMALQHYDCATIIAIDINDDKLNFAKKLGADICINANHDDVSDIIANTTQQQGVDYAFEASGNCDVIAMAFQSVRKNGGLCVFASHPPNDEKIMLSPHDLIAGKQIRGSWGGSCQPDKDIPILADLYLKGKLPLENLLSKPYSLEQINQACDDFKTGNLYRPLIAINPNLAQELA